MFEYLSVLWTQHTQHAYMDMYLCELSWDGTARWWGSAGWDIAGVSLCLSAQPLIAAI